MLSQNLGIFATYVWSIMVRLLNSIMINQTPGGLMDSLSPKCKQYITGFVARSLVNKLNHEDRSMLMYSGRFVNELGFYKSCTSTSNMAYYLIQAGAEIVRVNLGVCFTEKCSAADVQVFQNYMFTKIKDKISKPTSILYKAKDYLVFNVNRVEQVAKSIVGDPIAMAFYACLLICVVLVLLASVWKFIQNQRIKSALQTDNKPRSFLDSSEAFPSTPLQAKPAPKTTQSPSFSQDSYSHTKDTTLATCFSLQHNWRLIANYKVESAEQMTIDLLRSLSYVGVLAMNIAYIEAELSKIGVDTTTRNYYVHGFKHTALQGSLLVPDLFLMLGGYTAVLSVLRVFQRVDLQRNKLKYPIYYALLVGKRFLRYTLALFLGMAFVWKILPQISSGPLSASDLGCNRSNFWASVFLWNSNFAGNGRRMCGPWYWYPAVDFQLFLIAPLICLMYVISPRKGILFSGIMTVLALFVTAIYDQTNNIKAVNDHDVSWITNYMTISYLRAFPYLGGCTFALYRRYKKQQILAIPAPKNVRSSKATHTIASESSQFTSIVSAQTGPELVSIPTALASSPTKLYISATLVGFVIFLVNGALFYYYFQAYRHNLDYPQWKHTLFNVFAPPGFALSFLLIFGGFVHVLFPYLKKESRAHIALLVLRAVYFEVFVVGVPFVLCLYFSFQGIPWFANGFAYFNMVWVLATAVCLALIFYLAVSRPYANFVYKMFRI